MRLRIAIVVFMVAVLSACSGFAQQLPPMVGEYQKSLKRWQQASLQNYDISYHRQCFCLAELVRPLRVEVRDGRIASAVYADDGSPLLPDLDYDLKSVDDFFDLIADAIDRSADKLHVSYDDTLGFPSSISIDYFKRMVDDEVTITSIQVVRK